MSRDASEFGYNYREIARLTGQTVNTVQQHRHRGHVNPKSLASVLVYMAQYGCKPLKAKIIEGAFAPLDRLKSRRPRKAA
jgi:hypothetical protein